MAKHFLSAGGKNIFKGFKGLDSKGIDSRD